MCAIVSTKYTALPSDSTKRRSIFHLTAFGNAFAEVVSLAFSRPSRLASRRWRWICLDCHCPTLFRQLSADRRGRLGRRQIRRQGEDDQHTEALCQHCHGDDFFHCLEILPVLFEKIRSALTEFGTVKQPTITVKRPTT